MKKYISLILCALLLVGLVFPAYAVSTDNTEPSEPSVPVETGGSEETAVSEETTVPSDPTETTASTNPTETTASTDPTETTAPTDPTETTAATDPTETTAPTDPTETTAATDPTETSAATDPTEASVATDPTETSPATEPENTNGAPEVFTVEAAYAYLLTIRDDAEATAAYLDTLTDEEIVLLVKSVEITEDELPAVVAYLQLRFPPYEFPTCVNDTNAAPLAQATLPRRMMFRAAAARQSDNGLKTSKTIIDHQNGTYILRLEAYATGSSYTSTTSKPTDIVLVLDTSGSMDDYISVADKNSVANLDPKYAEYYKWKIGLLWCDMRYQNGKWQYNTIFGGWNDCDASRFGDEAGVKKIDALKIAVDGFLDSIEEYGGDNRVALVAFASGATTHSGLTTDYDSVKNSVWNLSADGATYADSGMSNAKSIIDGISADRDSNKVVIMFTDGEPNHHSGFDTDVANTTIGTSKEMKDQGVTIYTIGVMNGANNADTTSNFNRYMNYVSSNYPKATNMTNGGDKYQHPEGGNYYLTADNLQDLQSIFQNVSSEVGGATNSELDENTVMRDIIADSFQLPANADENSIVVYTADCTGIDDNGTPTFGADQPSDLTASITADRRTIEVTGFHYSDNYVGKNTTTGELHQPGKKLIVEIPIVVRDGFLGGNDVPTNGTGSGVYLANGTEVNTFIAPTVDLAIIPPTVTANTINAYLMRDVQVSDLYSMTVYDTYGNPIEKFNPAASSNNYGLEAWQTAYLQSIEVTVPKDGYVDLREDVEFTAGISIVPEGEGEAKTQSVSANGKINVFKPVLTFQDDTVDYKSTIADDKYVSDNTEKNFGDDNYASSDTVWKHGETASSAVSMTGSEPRLDLVYGVVSGVDSNGVVTAMDQVPVNVDVNIGDVNVDEYTTFIHSNCVFEGCEWDDLTSGNGDPAFLLHVINTVGDLTIKKMAAENTNLGDQTFLFTVTGPDDFSMEVVIQGKGSVTIKDLPVGTYRVTEDTAWSWRFTPVGDSVVDVTVDTDGGTARFTNELDDGKWFDGNAYCENKFGAYTSSTGE